MYDKIAVVGILNFFMQKLTEYLYI